MKTNIELCLECKIKPTYKDNPFHCKKCQTIVARERSHFLFVQKNPHLVEYTYLTEEEKSRGEI